MSSCAGTAARRRNSRCPPIPLRNGIAHQGKSHCRCSPIGRANHCNRRLRSRHRIRRAPRRSARGQSNQSGQTTLHTPARLTRDPKQSARRSRAWSSQRPSSQDSTRTSPTRSRARGVSKRCGTLAPRVEARLAEARPDHSTTIYIAPKSPRSRQSAESAAGRPPQRSASCARRQLQCSAAPPLSVQPVSSSRDLCSQAHRSIRHECMRRSPPRRSHSGSPGLQAPPSLRTQPRRSSWMQGGSNRGPSSLSHMSTRRPRMCHDPSTSWGRERGRTPRRPSLVDICTRRAHTHHGSSSLEDNVPESSRLHCSPPSIGTRR